MRRILCEIGKVVSGRLRIHLLCWLIFIVYEITMVSFLSFRSAGLGSYFLFYSLNISLFYFHSLYILPLVFERKNIRWWRFTFIVFELAAYIMLAVLLNYLYYNVFQMGVNRIKFNTVLFVNIIFRGIYFMLYGTGYYFLLRFIRKQKEEAQRRLLIEQLEKQLLQAQIDYLRAQINPHFLFNSLTFIKNSFKRSPENADEAILLLSDILTFAMSDNNQEEVVLRDEINQIENIIRLNQLRFDDELSIRLVLDIQNNQRTIMPMALLTLVENVFKHGNLHIKDQPAEIYIEENAEKVIFRTRNLRDLGPRYSNNSGLRNIRMRLESNFPGKHRFDYSIEGNYYVVYLEFQL